MILVTLGTHEQPFERALDLVSELEREHEDVVVQHGATPPRTSSERVTWVAYLDWHELTATMQSAEAVVTHAGVGSTVTAMRAGKKPIMIPRLARFGEHVDDHQVQLADRFAERDAALVCRLDSNVVELVAQARGSVPATLGERKQGLQRALELAVAA